jgi:hypothetical protein
VRHKAVVAETLAIPRQLVVHGRHGVTIVPLTGDDDFDALLRRVARSLAAAQSSNRPPTAGENPDRRLGHAKQLKLLAVWP